MKSRAFHSRVAFRQGARVTHRLGRGLLGLGLLLLLGNPSLAQSPALICPADITVDNDPDECGAVVNYPLPTAPPFSTSPTITCSPPPGSFFPVGTTTVNCSGSFPFTLPSIPGSGSGGGQGIIPLTPCSFKITVKDVQSPAVTCANVFATNDPGACSATVSPGTATATDNCTGVTVAGVRSDGEALTDPYPVGTTTITWTATDASGNTASCDQTVTVNDTEEPTITCPPGIIVPNGFGQCSATVSATATAMDNCAGVTVAGARSDGQGLIDPYPVGTTTIAWTATDASGNTASCTQTVTVRDVDPPTLTCPADISAVRDRGKKYATLNPGTAAATDNCGAVTVVGQRTDGLALTDPYPLGMTTILWTATDAAGYSTVCFQTISVDKK